MESEAHRESEREELNKEVINDEYIIKHQLVVFL